MSPLCSLRITRYRVGTHYISIRYLQSDEHTITVVQGVWRYVVQIPYEGYFTQTVEVVKCLSTKCQFLQVSSGWWTPVT